MTQHELNSERLHVMVKPATKEQLDKISRYDTRFASEAEVVRHLLETFLPDMARACTPRPVVDPTVQDDPIGDWLAPRKLATSELPRLTRDEIGGVPWGYRNDDAHRDAPLTRPDGVE